MPPDLGERKLMLPKLASLPGVSGKPAPPSPPGTPSGNPEIGSGSFESHAAAATAVQRTSASAERAEFNMGALLGRGRHCGGGRRGGGHHDRRRTSKTALLGAAVDQIVLGNVAGVASVFTLGER